MKSVFICTSPRSGSYHLADLLQQSGLPFAEEIFIPFHENALTRSYNLSHISNKIEFYKSLVRMHSKEGIFIAKLMPAQLKRVLKNIEHVSGAPSDFDIFSSIFPNPTFIHLTRKDVLAQAISLTKALQTGQWIKTSEEDNRYSIEPYYSYVEIVISKNRLTQMHNFWEEWFSSEGIDPLPIVYEQLVDNPAATLSRLLSSILENNRTCSFPENSRFNKTTSSVNQLWYRQFKQQTQQAIDRWPQPERPDIDSFRINKVSLLPEYEKYTRPHFDIEIESSIPEIDLIGDPNGLRWLTVNILVEHEKENLRSSSHFEVPPQEPDRNCYKLSPILCLPIPPGPVYDGDYKIHINLAWEPQYGDSIAANAQYSQQFRIKPLAAERESQIFFGDVKPAKDGWKELDWFGLFLDEHFPWIFHAEHNWLYFEPCRKSPEFRVYDKVIGWIALNPETYPEIKCLDTNEHLLYKGRKGNLRHFQNLVTKEFVTFPPCEGDSENDP